MTRAAPTRWDVHGLGETSLPPVMPAVGNAVVPRDRRAHPRPADHAREGVARPARALRLGPDDRRRGPTWHLSVNGRARPASARSRTTRCSRCCATISTCSACAKACGVGMCGACTVLARRPARELRASSSRRWPNGRVIVTIEARATGNLHVIQQAYVDHTAFQCSFCTPGFILTTHALLAENPTSNALRKSATTSPATCAAAAATSRSKPRCWMPPNV